MYEDYQPMKSTIDNIFGSVSTSPTATIQNPKFNFISFDDNPNFSSIIPKEEYEETGSDGSLGSGYEPVEDSAIEEQPPPVKKKRLHRHTARQIEEMEALFKQNINPDGKERKILSQKLGLKPLQVKFWFQNKRTQSKVQQDKRENVILREENNALKTVNYNLKSDLKSFLCSSCGVSGDKLRLENSLLRQELDRLRSIAYPPLPLQQDTVCFFPEINNNNAKEEKAVAMDLAVSCVQELTKMCDTNEPLWNKKRLGNNESLCRLNEEEYKMFCWPLMDSDRFRREASRAKSVVMMNSLTLVNAFLDADKWTEMFCSIVTRAKTIKIISSGVSGASGSLLLMYAELQVLSPLVPTREGYFLRYVEQNAEQGKCVIVDFPMDSFRGLIKPASSTTTADQYRRKPSGCIIHEMPNGYSQVTWVEHVEVEEKYVLHEMVNEYVKSGVAFGAKRWLAVLKRQCERKASLMATNITDLGVIPSDEARRSLMKLSQRMVRSFCLNMSNSDGQTLSESREDKVRITTRKVYGGGLVVCAVSTTFLPYSHLQVFNLIRHDHRRSQLEILCNGNSLQEVAHIANGSHPGNCISMFRNNVASNVELMLQETCTDNSGSLVVYSTVDAAAIQLVMNGNDSFKIPVLPLGFSVVPMNPPEGIFVNLESCLLTVMVQVLTSNVASARLNFSTVTTIDNCICSVVDKITSALGSGGSVVPKDVNADGN